jgi:hypothetical protein
MGVVLPPEIFGHMTISFGEGSEFDGYCELRLEDYAKVVKGWQDGHVADEDIPDSARKRNPADEDGGEKLYM